MKKVFKIATVLLIATLINSCGIFKKKCDCPKFSTSVNR